MEQITLLTKAEAAELLHVSETTVNRLLAARKLPCYRINKQCVRLDRRAVLDYLESRQISAASLRQTRVIGPKDLRRSDPRERVRGSGYYPGMKVVDPNG